MNVQQGFRRILDARDALHANDVLKFLVNAKKSIAIEPRRQWYLCHLGPARDTFAARVIPGTVGAWPLGRGGGLGVATLGSNLTHSLSTVAFAGYIRPISSDGSMGRLIARWPPIVDALRKVQEALGGPQEPLDYLEQVVHHELLPLRNKPIDVQRAILREVLPHLDPSPEMQRFVDFGKQVFESPEAQVPPDDLGAWTGYAACLAMHHQSDKVGWAQNIPEAVSLSAWMLLHEPAPFDTHASISRDSQNYQRSFSGNNHNADALHYAIVYVSKAPPALLDQWADDPLFQHVLIPFAEDADGPWHLGYMKAAAQFDGLDQPTLAWNMLASGQYWQNVRGGDAPWFDAALSLAKRREWPDVIAALEDAAAASA